MKRIEFQTRLLWVATFAVVAWRVAALVHPHPANADPGLVRNAMAALGIVFLACGLWSFVRSPSWASYLFAWFAITAGLHWGGPVGFGSSEMQNVLLAFYVVVSTGVGMSLFLHLAVAFPTPFAIARKRTVLALIYLPTWGGTVLLGVLLLAPSNGQLLGAVALLFPLDILYSLIALGVWIARAVAAAPSERRERRLTVVVAAMLVGWSPYVIVSNGLSIWPGYEGIFNLPMGLVPIALAAALSTLRSDSARSRGSEGGPE